MTYDAEESQEDDVQICMKITDLPDDGLECDVIVLLNTMDGEKTGKKGIRRRLFPLLI